MFFFVFIWHKTESVFFSSFFYYFCYCLKPENLMFHHVYGTLDSAEVDTMDYPYDQTKAKPSVAPIDKVKKLHPLDSPNSSSCWQWGWRGDYPDWTAYSYVSSHQSLSSDQQCSDRRPGRFWSSSAIDPSDSILSTNTRALPQTLR